jgi:hypothetical protein
MFIETPKVQPGLISCVLFLLAMAFSSCDSMEDDAMPKTPNVSIDDAQVFVLPNGTAYIDLYSKIQTNGKVSLSIASQPRRGELSEVAAGLLKYTPSSSFERGTDGFKFSVRSSTNEIILQDSVVIVVGDSTHIPCGLYPSDDWVDTDSTTVEVDVLQNDYICGDSTDVIVEIYKPGSHFPPHFGTASVTSNNRIRYVATGVEVVDTVVYKVSRKSDRSLFAFGTLYVDFREGAPCLDWLEPKTGSFSSSVVGRDSLSVYLKPDEPLCSMDHFDSLSVATPPVNGTARVNRDTIWYVFELTQAKRKIQDSLVYRWCSNGDCVDGRYYININQ